MGATQPELSEDLRDFADVMLDDLSGLTAATFEHMNEPMPEWMLEPSIREMATAHTRASIEVELNALRGGGEIPKECPPIDEEGARLGARAGSPLNLLLDGFRAGHRAQWEAWMAVAEERIEAPDRRRALLARGSDFFFDYAARLSALVTDIYMAERDAAMRGQEQRRVLVVRQILDREPVEPAALEHPVAGCHVGVVASGSAAKSAVAEALAGLASRSLLVEVTDELAWGWITGPGAAGDAANLGHAPQKDESGLRLGIGRPLDGLDGFRSTHRQAVCAHRASLALDQAVTSYVDVALEDLASRDEQAASEFVAEQLAGLDGDGRREVALRETLRAYFASGHNAKSTAARLGVHQQTVAQRLRTVEERLGISVIERRCELETALRLRAYLPADGAPGTGTPRTT